MGVRLAPSNVEAPQLVGLATPGEPPAVVLILERTPSGDYAVTMSHGDDCLTTKRPVPARWILAQVAAQLHDLGLDGHNLVFHMQAMEVRHG